MAREIPRVAGDSFKDDLVLGKLPSGLGVLDEILGEAVFNGAPDVAPFQLGVEGGVLLRRARKEYGNVFCYMYDNTRD